MFEKIGGRKFTLALLALALVVLNSKLGLGMDFATILSALGLPSIFVILEGIRDIFESR